ncbi:hypothetical protein D910_04740 [Dendroctonus ponderosae]|uniref:Ig-like domain-containing protein n=1 Tax=Dendroctonus ponderosae TaxID=77166 RepID=U4UBN5_DENPD|nr:hypothetical protein D910_04740 [Dendroctonus ponderosae]
MINYDNARGGITVETALGPPRAHSRLTIQNTKQADSGNYTCSASNTEPASIHKRKILYKFRAVPSVKKNALKMPIKRRISLIANTFWAGFEKIVAGHIMDNMDIMDNNFSETQNSLEVQSCAINKEECAQIADKI